MHYKKFVFVHCSTCNYSEDYMAFTIHNFCRYCPVCFQEVLIKRNARSIRYIDSTFSDCLFLKYAMAWGA